MVRTSIGTPTGFNSVHLFEKVLVKRKLYQNLIASQGAGNHLLISRVIIQPTDPFITAVRSGVGTELGALSCR